MAKQNSHYPESVASSTPSHPVKPEDQALQFENSIYDETDQDTDPSALASGPYREYSFYYTKAHAHLLICGADPQKTPVYFAETSEWRRHKPDVTLHSITPQSTFAGMFRGSLSAEEAKKTPVVAAAYFGLSRHVKLGVGDPGDSGSVVWEEMKNCKMLGHSEYRFELNDKTSHSNSLQGTRRSYTWQRTRSVADGVEGGAFVRHMSLDNYKLIEGASGKTVASFLQNAMKSWRKKGKIRFYESEDVLDMGMEVEIVALLSIASICEKARRRRR